MNEHNTGNPPLHTTSSPTTPQHQHQHQQTRTRTRTSSYGSSTTDSIGAAPPPSSPSHHQHHHHHHPTTTTTSSSEINNSPSRPRSLHLPIASIYSYPWDMAYILYVWITQLFRYLIGTLMGIGRTTTSTTTEGGELEKIGSSPLSFSSSSLSREGGRRRRIIGDSIGGGGRGTNNGGSGPYSSNERNDGRIPRGGGDGGPSYGIGGTLGGIIRNHVVGVGGGGGANAMPELELVPEDDYRDTRGGRDGGRRTSGAGAGAGGNRDGGGADNDRPTVRSQRETTRGIDGEFTWRNTIKDGETNQDITSSKHYPSRSSNGGVVGVSSSRTTIDRTDLPLYDTNIEPAFLNAEEYPPEWLTYDPVKGMVVKRIELMAT